MMSHRLTTHTAHGLDALGRLSEVIALAAGWRHEAVSPRAKRVERAAVSLATVAGSGDSDRIATSLTALARALDELDDDEPETATARAWADLALGEVALAVRDLRVAHQRFYAAAGFGRLTTLRLVAMLQLVDLAIERRDLESARTWARKAATLSHVDRQSHHATRARLVCVLLDYAVGDVVAMRRSVASGNDGFITRLLLATAEPPRRAITMLAELLDTEDPFHYALCVLVASRRMADRRTAIAVLEIGITSLEQADPALAHVLIGEREALEVASG